MRNGFGKVPLVITECGIDSLVNAKPPGAGRSGTWKQPEDSTSFFEKHYPGEKYPQVRPETVVESEGAFSV